MNDWDTPIASLAKIPSGMPEAPPMTQDAGALLKLADWLKHMQGQFEFVANDPIIKGHIADLVNWENFARQAASQGSAGGEVPICCYCDNTLCCAHCGKEQPADASPPVKTGGGERTAVQSEDAIDLADHDEISRKVLGLPWAIQSAIVTIAAHCTVIKDKCPAGDVSDLAGCISQDLLELANALSGGVAQAAPVREPKQYVAELSLNGKYTWCIVEAFPRIENVIKEFGFGPDAYRAAQDELADMAPSVSSAHRGSDK